VRKALFAISAGLLGWAQAGYPLALIAAGPREDPAQPVPDEDLPHVSLIVAAYAEQDVIAAKVANALALDYPRERLEVIVACDGSPDATAGRAREAGADVVLELPRGGKVRAQDAAVRAARGEVVAFSDANAQWEPGALRALVAPLRADGRVGEVVGQVAFTNAEGDNQEGLYWRLEMAMRERESAIHSVTAGNGAIYATRRDAYIEVDPVMGHDLSFPFNLVKRGWRAVYAPGARATEKMVPTIEGELARKRRMMSHAWPIVLRGGLLDPRGYPPRYGALILSHRVLRYASPFLHLLALLTRRRRALRAQLAFLALAGAGRAAGRPGLIARYYTVTTASIALGAYDWARHGTEAGWSPPEGTR
jgi:cellulose synthase/poly-beta-1,6-N-acetylglucosamine synthase-like glycosyltransferase